MRLQQKRYVPTHCAALSTITRDAAQSQIKTDKLHAAGLHAAVFVHFARQKAFVMQNVTLPGSEQKCLISVAKWNDQ